MPLSDVGLFVHDDFFQTFVVNLFLLDEDPLVKNPEQPVELGKVKGRIQFENVWFAYQGEDWILKDVSFTIEPGQRVAFVGATGAGKSSILNLIGRYDGSNRMGRSRDARWLPTWSVSGKWDIGSEDFMKEQKAFEYLKFRASWGLLGNDSVPANSTAIVGASGTGASGVFDAQSFVPYATVI